MTSSPIADSKASLSLGGILLPHADTETVGPHLPATDTDPVRYLEGVRWALSSVGSAISQYLYAVEGDPALAPIEAQRVEVLLDRYRPVISALIAGSFRDLPDRIAEIEESSVDGRSDAGVPPHSDHVGSIKGSLRLDEDVRDTRGLDRDSIPKPADHQRVSDRFARALDEFVECFEIISDTCDSVEELIRYRYLDIDSLDLAESPLHAVIRREIRLEKEIHKFMGALRYDAESALRRAQLDRDRLERSPDRGISSVDLGAQPAEVVGNPIRNAVEHAIQVFLDTHEFVFDIHEASSGVDGQVPFTSDPVEETLEDAAGAASPRVAPAEPRHRGSR